MSLFDFEFSCFLCWETFRYFFT